jgi:hypothetical protein
MGHAYNYGMVGSSKGLAVETLRLVCTDGSGTLSVAEDGKAGLVSAVTRNAQGDYTVQLAKPYPPKIVTIQGEASTAGKTTASVNVRYKTASYDATAGTFSFFTSDGAGTSAVDPANAQEIHLLVIFRRYTTM